MVAQEASMLSERSLTATDLSKKTDRTSYSIPDDGRAVTISTDRRRKRREDRDNQSVLSAGTNTSLLIEYFENGKAGSSGRQPSVRVKVTPSAAKRHNVNPSADGTGVEISDVNGPGRRPTHTHRIQLAPHTGEDRLTLGRTRSYSGDHSSLSSYVSGQDESLVGNRRLDVTVVGNQDGGDNADRRRRRRTTSRGGAADSYYDDSFKSAKQRSRSVSRESDIQKEAGLKPKLNRRRSRSLSRERLSQRDKERIEQAIREELEKAQNPKLRKEGKGRVRYDTDLLKPPRVRSRSRNNEVPLDEIAAEKVRARRKAALIEGDDRSMSSQRSTTNPALVELIRGTIRELLLPEIEQMKANQGKGASTSNLVSEGTERSIPGSGNLKQDDPSSQRPLRPGMPHSPMVSEGEGVPLAAAIGENLVSENRAPYPTDGNDTAMPGNVNSPPPLNTGLSDLPESNEPSLVRPLSLEDLSTPTTSIVAKERKSRRRQSRKGVDELSDIYERDDASTSSRAKAVSSFLAEQREREQEKAYMTGAIQDTSMDVRHLTTIPDNSFDARRLDKVDTGHQVFDLGANPSMRSTPVNALSAVASILDPSNVGSALSGIRPSPKLSPQPQLGANAMPQLHDPLPDFSHQAADDEDEINTNPSIIQGPIGHQGTNWDITNEFGVSGEGGLNVDLNPQMQRGSLSPHPNSLLSPSGGKDEGYITAADPIGSPGTATPDQGMRGGVGSIDNMLSDGDLYRSYQRDRVGSGNSHGMPSPLYDSSTGRGMDRIESKDIVALMEHLTVRDAQRNARDTEILVTLVRSAAEMRNSFEDMKRALADQRRDIVNDVDQNTERSVQKVLQGPRPLPPSTPRKPRYSSSGDAEDEARENRARRSSIFKRALKGLSTGSSKDLERIEEMLCKLLGEVEGLKDNQQFYQQSVLQSQSMATLDQARSVQDPNDMAGSNASYYGAGQSQLSSGKLYEHHQTTAISPIAEVATLGSPHVEPRAISPPIEPRPPLPKSAEKPAKREAGSSSLFPTGGLKNLFSKNKHKNPPVDPQPSEPDFNYWETEEAKRINGDPHQSPFGSQGYQSDQRAGSPISLDIQHPRPRVTYSNHQLEQQAQQLAAEGGNFIPQSPNTGSVSSLGNYPPLEPGGFQNGKLLSPLARDAYAQHQAQLTPNGSVKPLSFPGEGSQDGESVRRHKKHRERDESGAKVRKPKKERTEEEKQRRREKREERKRSKDLLSEDGQPSVSGRSPSTASKLNGPRPLSNAGNKGNPRREFPSETVGSGTENEYVSYR